MDNIMFKRPEETDSAYLLRLGSLKDAGIVKFSWPQLAIILNNETEVQHPLDESTWRKRYQSLCLADSLNQQTSPEVNESTSFKGEFTDNQNIPDDPCNENKECLNNDFESRKMIIRLRDERYALNRIVRSDARRDALLDLFKTEIKRFDAVTPPKVISKDEKPKAIYALLSDIHYGIAFESSVGEYNSEIASERVLRYACEIVRIGKMFDAEDCYVSLLGDMISGVIHAPIRIENRENAVEQVVGVSELTADFLYVLAGYFQHIYVNSVSGNHSRIEMIAENSLRAEKLDALIPWYCEARLENVPHVVFVDNTIDPTICSFDIMGKTYAGVHGDYDKDLAKSAMHVERALGKSLDYMLAGHLHVPNLLFDDRGYIRNGSICGSGDDYTMRHRLFSNPYQLCMTVSEDGVESIWPINLS